MVLVRFVSLCRVGIPVRFTSDSCCHCSTGNSNNECQPTLYEYFYGRRPYAAFGPAGPPRPNGLLMKKYKIYRVHKSLRLYRRPLTIVEQNRIEHATSKWGGPQIINIFFNTRQNLNFYNFLLRPLSLIR